MKRTLLWIVALIVILGASTGAILAQDKTQGKDIAGNWQGTLQAGKGLRIVMKITKDDGKLKGISYSIDQGGQPIPITSMTLDGTAFNFAIKALDVTYVGTLSPDGNTITGNQTQGGNTSVMNFERSNADTAWPIPEPPKSMDPNATPKFDVVTIKPSKPDQQGKGFGFRGRQMRTINTNLNDLITFAYNLHVKQIVGAPAWFATDHFDLDGVPDVEGQPNAKQMKLLVQSVLADRFKLTFHHDQKELSVYALTVGKGGPKLTETIHRLNDPGAFFFRKLGALTVANFTMKDFCDGMQSAVMDKPVVDHTGLTARYDFTLNWTPDESQFEALGGYKPPATEDPNAPPVLSTAMQEQLGLKLDATKALADAFVIDHAEKPSAN
jgi:uncharacterized protein (TIGR03435 family)